MADDFVENILKEWGFENYIQHFRGTFHGVTLKRTGTTGTYPVGRWAGRTYGRRAEATGGNK